MHNWNIQKFVLILQFYVTNAFQIYREVIPKSRLFYLNQGSFHGIDVSPQSCTYRRRNSELLTSNGLQLQFFFSSNECSRILLFAKVQDEHGSGSGDESDEGGTPPPQQIAAPKFHSFGLTSRSLASKRKALGKGKDATVHLCTNCGAESVQWVGRCPTCKEWNTVQPFRAPRDEDERTRRLPVNPPELEESMQFGAISSNADGPKFGNGFSLPAWVSSTPAAVSLASIPEASLEKRILLQTSELARTLGGQGVVPGSLVLVGGDPGVGKSTLLLQMAGELAHTNTTTVVYCSGEESSLQVASRARRLGFSSANLLLLSETNVDAIVDQVAYMNPQPAVLIIDSIQTMRAENLPSQTGSVTQVKECGLRLLQLAKTCNIAVFLIGHVTKTGDFAGPKILEHMVDTVLYLEGEKYSTYRLLRSVKNRYGSSNEIGVFEMGSRGMQEVPNPSVLFLSQAHDEDGKEVDGSSIAVILEGSRPILVEVQSLVSYTKQFPPRRAVEGISYQRAMLLLAVLERRLGYQLGSREVFINVVGGLKLQETASDLSVMVAVVSSATSNPVRPGTVFIGEVGLGGELRAVPQMERRIIEAAKFGFTRMILPSTIKLEGLKKHGGNVFRAEAINKNAKNGQVDIVLCNTVKIALQEGLSSTLRSPVEDSHHQNEK